MGRFIGGIAIVGTTIVGLVALPASDIEHAPQDVPDAAGTDAPVVTETPGIAVDASIDVDRDTRNVLKTEGDARVSPADIESVPIEMDRLIGAIVWGRYALEPRGAIVLPLVEIVAHDAARKRLLATCDKGLAVIDVSDPDRPVVIRMIDVAGTLGMGERTSMSHVSVDPMGRDVAVVSVLPERKARTPGRIAFVSLTRLEVIGSVPVGFGPDAVEFSPDGRYIAVANEGEYAPRPDGTIDDPPGSVTIISLPGVENEWHFEQVTEQDARHAHFAGPSMRSLLTRGREGDPEVSVRLHPLHAFSPATDLEPESIAIIDGVAHVSLQENNAIAAFDLETGELLRISTLGASRLDMDVSDRDGPDVGTTMSALRMPDQLKAFRAGGRAYLITANEGDTRGEIGEGEPLLDHGRLRDLDRDGRLGSAIGEIVRQSPNGLGRLQVCAIMGDYDNDGRIDEPMALGARGVSVFDASTHELIGDSGSRFATIIEGNWPRLLNAGADDEPTKGDKRSDNRGCEPEGVVIGAFDGKTLAFVGLERPGAVAVIDLTDPRTPEVVGMTMIAELGHFHPEGLAFIAGDEPMVAVACELSGTLGLWRVVDRYAE